MFSYSTGYYVSPPVDQYLKFKNRCSLVHILSGGARVRFPDYAVQYFLSCGEADYTASGHSKSRRENKNFGLDQNALL